MLHHPFRFALLEHDHPSRHWDLLLEHGPACRTWRLERVPESQGPVPAEAAADHRLMYLDYAGPVSGNRGTVTSCDAGTCVWLTAKDDHVAVLLTGRAGTYHVDLVLTGSGWEARMTPRE